MSTNLHIDHIGNLILRDGTLSLFVSSQYVTPPHYGGGRVGALSPYAYCAGDPVNLIDPTGCAPDSLEAAQMADHVYEGKGELSGGWTCVSINRDDNTGLQWGVYQRLTGDNLEINIAFAGSEKSDFSDWMLDLQQYFGGVDGNNVWSTQYGQAYHIALSYLASLSDDEDLSFSGHSLGGGLAQVASMVTEVPAFTFNPAGLHDNTIKALDLGGSPTNQINNYFILGEIVSLGSFLSPSVETQGNYNVKIKNTADYGIFAGFMSLLNHSISNFK